MNIRSTELRWTTEETVNKDIQTAVGTPGLSLKPCGVRYYLTQLNTVRCPLLPHTAEHRAVSVTTSHS